MSGSDRARRRSSKFLVNSWGRLLPVQQHAPLPSRQLPGMAKGVCFLVGVEVSERVVFYRGIPEFRPAIRQVQAGRARVVIQAVLKTRPASWSPRAIACSLCRSRRYGPRAFQYCCCREWTPVVAAPRHTADFSDAISITKRYFTSCLTRRSQASLIF